MIRLTFIINNKSILIYCCILSTLEMPVSETSLDRVGLITRCKS